MSGTSTRLGGIVCAVALLGVSSLLVRTSFSAPDSKYALGGQEKIKVDLTGDPEIDRARWQVAFDAAKEVQRRTVEEAIAKKEARVKSHGWDGTRLRIRPEITDADTRAAHQAVCEIFLSVDPPAPAGRADQFKAFFNAGPKTRVTGYHGEVESVIATEDG